MVKICVKQRKLKIINITERLNRIRKEGMIYFFFMMLTDHFFTLKSLKKKK